jgi:hypothetical protein
MQKSDHREVTLAGLAVAVAAAVAAARDRFRGHIDPEDET